MKANSGHRPLAPGPRPPILVTPGRRGLRTVLWAAWLFTAFVATHLPPLESPVPFMIRDKLMHFVGFTVLGILTIWRTTGGGARLVPRMVVGWYLALVAYALFDEATQELVGRTFEWADWVADCGGAAAGTFVGILCYRWTMREKADEG